MDEHRQGVATNGARAESRSEQGWGKDMSKSAISPETRIRLYLAAQSLGYDYERFIRAVSRGREPGRVSDRDALIAVLRESRPITLSYPQIAALFSTSHSNIHDAYRRHVRRRAIDEGHS